MSLGVKPKSKNPGEESGAFPIWQLLQTWHSTRKAEVGRLGRSTLLVSGLFYEPAGKPHGGILSSQASFD